MKWRCGTLLGSAVVAPPVPGDPNLGDEGRICRRRRLVRALLDAVERGDPWAVRLAFERVWPIGSGPGDGPKVFLRFDHQDSQS